MKEAILLTDGYKLDHRRQYPEGYIRQLLGFHYPDRERTIYVTHMVNPKGITTLSENYKEVYFTNSYKDWNKETLPDNVKVIEIV